MSRHTKAKKLRGLRVFWYRGSVVVVALSSGLTIPVLLHCMSLQLAYRVMVLLPAIKA